MRFTGTSDPRRSGLSVGGVVGLALGMRNVLHFHLAPINFTLQLCDSHSLLLDDFGHLTVFRVSIASPC